MQQRDMLRKFISANLVIYEENAKFTDEDNLFQKGFVDSMFALKLVQYVEKEFGIKVENSDLQLSNFSSITNIVNLVASKKGGAAANG